FVHIQVTKRITLACAADSEPRPTAGLAHRQKRCNASIISEDIDGAGFAERLVVLVSVHALGGAVFAGRTDGNQRAVPIDCDGTADQVVCAAIGVLDVGLLPPSLAAAGKDVGGAGFFARIVLLVAVDTFRAAIFVGRADNHGVAVSADGDSHAKPILLAGIGG